MCMKYSEKDFLIKANAVHNGRYDYSKVEYKGSQIKICIICPEHGEFWQIPSAHLRGNGCPKCSNAKRGRKTDVTEFIDKCKKKHGNVYDYSKVEYVNSNTKVCIICPEHGEFWMLPMAHLEGQGCPKCSGRNLSADELEEKMKQVHNGKFTYDMSTYTKMNAKMKMFCPIHGEFWQSPTKHIRGQQCPKCSAEKRWREQLLDTDSFIARAKEMYGNLYDYSKVDYKSMKDKVEIICPKHGSFFQRPYDHLQHHGCPTCGKLNSSPETEIYEFLLSHFNENDIRRNDRSILDGKEIDIYIPSIKFGIEYNGLKWHSEEFGKDCHYHEDKMILSNNKGISLVQIFEDEWLYKKDIVLNKLKHLLHLSTVDMPTIMGRKCYVREIDKKTAKAFLDKFHIQGYGKCTLSLGCFNGEDLIGVMSFLSHKNNEWELVRFATDYNYICQGVGGKMFSFFIKEYDPLTVKTFADRRWTLKEDNLYTCLGFVKEKIIKPDYRYVCSKNPSNRIHKFNFRKNIINLRYSLPMTMTESEMAHTLGYYKIWDCGLIRYVYKKKVL